MKIGYALSSEEHAPSDLVADAQRAEAAGFDFLMISDHFHPWVDRQGHSPFVWNVLGGIAATTERIPIGTGVTCPIIRIHPAIVAQAAATTAAMMPGRFWLGLGTGENLNEHVLGDPWPPGDVRLEMLEEAVEVIRELWTGEAVSHRGRYYTVQQARIYTLPDELPPILIAAKGERATRLAAGSDGLISTVPEDEVVQNFENAGGAGKPKIGMMHVCWARDEADVRKTAREWWPNTSVPGELTVELPLPRHFEQASQNIDEDDVASSITVGPALGGYVEAVRKYTDAGYDHVYIHQIGPDQSGFIDFARAELLPAIRSS
ncbi:MAG TPA: TIGR03557 family F420-dependent LLM class oxidoreductase [Actinomycetota bacterium]|nr:TIGR03557 family F420-dependent LLM class oxidoreductase [Actinomycetota bacterium]